jgi:hypothetical protein
LRPLATKSAKISDEPDGLTSADCGVVDFGYGGDFSHIVGRAMLLVFLAGTFVFGFTFGFVCCWAVARHMVSTLKGDLEALRFAVGGD